MKSTQRIGLLLALVILLPALFFSVYQFSSLNDDEKIIQEIYQKQLDAILFSANQYSDDILNSWVFKIEAALFDEKSSPEKLDNFLMLNAPVQGIFVADTAMKNFESRSLLLPPEDSTWQSIKTGLFQSSQQIQKLIGYKRSGFQKVDQLHANFHGDSTLYQCLIFINERGGDYRVVGLLIEPELFIENIIGPRLQSIAQDQFMLTAMRQHSDGIIYTTNPLIPLERSETIVTKDLWIFPDYTLGISTTGTTIQQLVKERTQSNMIVLISLNVIIVFGVLLVFRNLKREVDLAQNKSDFVSNVSHEIRTPLALISMFAETLELNRVPTEEKKREYYTIIGKETQRLSGIVNKILNFSQIEANKKVFHPETLDLNQEINSILKTYDFHLRSKGFEYSFHPSVQVLVLADKEAFVEIVINIIDNAIKYSDTIKRIEISTGYDSQYGFVSIKDHGVGISKKDLKYIFDKFYRVSSGNLAKTRGTGIGLSLVKQLVEHQKGKIMVSSTPGEGSTFTVYFQLLKNEKL